MHSLPPLIKVIEKFSCQSSYQTRNTRYKYGMLVLTFFTYMSYHLSRKPLSIVKGALHHNCSENQTFHLEIRSLGGNHSNSHWCDFAPFGRDDYKALFGDLDYAFLFSYAVGMFFSGFIAERVSLRYFLSIGMILSGIFTSMFGLGYFTQVHAFWFYIIAQILNGLAQTTGWPGVVTCVGNWFGKSKRGLIMGIWNSHTSIGNILGSIVASVFVTSQWGFSFIIPGIIIAMMGVIVFLTLIEHPEDLQLNSRSDEGQPICNYQRVPSKENINDEAEKIEPPTEETAIGFIAASQIPGVIEFSLCLFFAKLVSYTFLFWLPLYIQNASTTVGAEDAGLLSTLFDVGGIIGGIVAGIISDKLGGRACTCGGMLLTGAVMMFIYNQYGSISFTVNVILLLITGAFVNGPYALITTAVSADLGTHQVLQGNSKALSTVTAIIDGTGSIGAAIGPLLTGYISQTGWSNVFYMLISANILAVFCLTRLLYKEMYLFSITCLRSTEYNQDLLSDEDIDHA